MKQIFTKTLVVVASLVVALIMCEAGLRLLGIEYPDFYDFDPCLGSRLRAGISGHFNKEGGGYVSINSDGLRDREHSLYHPLNTLRIAVLGDSFAEAMQVNREEAFWAIMEKNLQGCPHLQGREVEVINFGQAGFGTGQELLALRHRVWRYSPDVVLLAFFTDNVRRNSPALMLYDFNPYFTLQDGELVLHDRRTREKCEEVESSWTWAWKFMRWRQDHFRVSQVLYQAERAWESWWANKGQPAASAVAKEGSEAGLLDNIYFRPADPVWQDAWKVTEALLLQMRDEVTARGAKFFVVVLTTGIQVNPDPATREAFAKGLGVQDLFYPDHRLETFCQQKGIPVLLLAPAFQEYATTHQVFLHGFKDNPGGGHWNQNGHRLAGEMITKWLCGQLH